MTTDAAHWEAVYTERPPDRVSWYEPVPASSLAMIDALGLPRDAPVLDVGGGASSLAAELVARGYEDVTVADLSATALARAREACPTGVRWVVADVRTHLFGRRFALWHDRAVFHFMVDPADRRAYLTTLERSLAPGGHVILATFGPGGPTQCSGLPVRRYGAEALAAELGDRARLVDAHLEEHVTPAGTPQQFLYAHLAAPG